MGCYPCATTMTCSYAIPRVLHFSLFAGAALAVGCGDDTSAQTDASSTTGSPASSGTDDTGEDPPTTAVTDSPTSGDTTADTSDGTSTGVVSTSSESGSESGGESTTGEPDGWLPPMCRSVTGTGAVTFSFDQGATVAPMDQMITPVHYTFGLVALGKPGAMLAGSGEKLLASSDAGCSWHEIGPGSGPNTPAMRLRAAGDTRAYAFGDNDSVIVRVDDEVITKLTSPAGQDGIVGLGVDPQDPDHVRIGDSAGRLWDSTDAGVMWAPAGIAAINDSLAYRAAFDPQDLDHALFGVLGDGVLVSHDGGSSWDPASGLGPGSANGFNLIVSPVDGDVVWLEGLDLEEPDESMSRHIYRSEDGGLVFTAVIEANEATLYNGNHLFAHPTDVDVLYFVYGASFANYGTDLYRYDYGTDAITKTHNKWHDTVIEFLPGDPSVIYLGLSIEPGGG